MKRKKSKIYNAEITRIRNILHGRHYSLGMDLGVGSIGIAVVAMEPDEDGNLYATDIVYAGSRIFPSSSGAAERRLQRGQRNSLRHRANRLRKLWQLLATRNLMKPYSKDDVQNPATLRFSSEMIKSDPYMLRLKGLKEQLSLEELGVALYHIANHRGSSSVRSFLDQKKTDDEKKSEEQIGETARLANSYGVDTYIELIDRFNKYELIKKGLNGYRNKAERAAKVIMPIPTRDIIRKEFDKLIDTQRKYHKDVLDDKFIAEIRDIVFFENIKIVPEAGACPYFPEEKKLPKAAFINEERRLWEALNNVRIHKVEQTIDGRITYSTKSLDIDEKELLFSVLREGKDISPAYIRKAFPQYGKLENKDILLQGVDKNNTKIKGFRFTSLEKLPCFSSLSEDDKDEYIALFVNTPDDETLKKNLISNLKFSDDEANFAIKNTPNLVGDYAPVGKTAMTLLMPLIKDGLSFQEAEAEALKNGILESSFEKKVYDCLPYYGEVIPNSTQTIAGKAWHSAFSGKFGKNGFIKPNTNPDEEKYGRIANPVVHQTLNELRKLVNEIISIMGKKPIEITVELGRELKLGQEAREKVAKENSSKEKENGRIYNTYCVPNDLSPKYIKRFRLWEEQGKKCPYCLEPINVSDIVSGSVDIDHIFPEDDTADSSENNLVVCHKHCNENAKGKQIPHSAFGANIELWRKIEQYLENTPALSKKRWRFEMTEEEYKKYLEKNTFLNRFKSDNAFVARIACEYLMSLFPEEAKYTAIRTIKGAETATLRRAWNLNGITQELASLHQSDKDSDSLFDGKNRSDARHHALDAIVAAYYTNATKKMINTVSKQTNIKEVASRIPIPKNYRNDKSLSTSEQRKAFRDTVDSFVSNMAFVSRKVDVNKNGQLLAATQYSILAANGDDLILVTKKRLKNLKANSFYGSKSGSVEYALKGKFDKPKWLSTDQRIKVDKLLSHNEKLFNSILGNAGKAREDLEDDNRKREAEGKKPIAIDEKRVVSKALELTGGTYYVLTNNKRKKIFVEKEPNQIEKGYAFDTGENYSLDLYHDKDGKLKGEIIRKINAINPKYVPEYKRKGFELFERIYNGDVLEVDFIPRSPDMPSKDFAKTIKAPNAPLERTFLIVKTFTETSSSIQVHYDSLLASKPEQNGSCYVSVFNKQNIRKVCLSEAGIVVYRSKLLKDLDCVESS